ncbi:hypothetical protein BRADI_2g47183v3 [Brachypodium distachyon]|uniref:Uncharacterized protein n=1 Tax=Brachypodium distachyon TaxID=15368 RepID=A0A2K2DED4_BRADI|nr:hypothetical protein BRADI_2g47183v3 [Brachypodium distachyon]
MDFVYQNHSPADPDPGRLLQLRIEVILRILIRIATSSAPIPACPAATSPPAATHHGYLTSMQSWWGRRCSGPHCPAAR